MSVSATAQRWLYLILIFLTNGGTVALIADLESGSLRCGESTGHYTCVHTPAEPCITPRTPVSRVRLASVLSLRKTRIMTDEVNTLAQGCGTALSTAGFQLSLDREAQF
jgi:hypothetical protein